MDAAPRRMVIIGYDQAELLDIACPASVLDAANRHGARPAYQVEFASLGGRPVTSACGIALGVQAKLEGIRGALDTVLVVGGWGHEAVAADERLVAQVRRLAGLSRRTASVCTGATVLAESGLLDGRRATTHWWWARELGRRYPAVTVDPAPIYLKDGEVYTAAGVTSGLDLALAFVEEDHGPDLARQVARSLVTYLHRPGNQAQVSMFLAGPPPEHGLVRSLTSHIAANVDTDLSAGALARKAGVSARQLTRLFDLHLGASPARYVRTVRVEAAAHLLASTRLPLTAVARRCGFNSTETLRRAFMDHYGSTPSVYRGLVSDRGNGQPTDADGQLGRAESKLTRASGKHAYVSGKHDS
ncbi:GlxA family transcriptional regulator [Amycolatopsis cihanbeyliensis]|uniref:Transcriptional regulator GlxA family with amidase domain n=1 Tax=Amycolatopsis cihanbeyliensis TaxID=1128664 RepID=A0A542CSJ3_AMYCI|nr:GlxA family transcriptional regulator [Amycolatopsis cihanbeyliensis]TQI93760.1 transcriptional regulator GlxA family with amidase domain [Amycolatopsis cihanbeyliensis]